jgi:hypothetical protein
MSFLVSRQLMKRIAVSQPNTIKQSFFIKNNALYRRSLTTQATEQQQQSPSSKTNQFMKKYGYVGIGVYVALGVVDLAATMAFISVKGAERVREVEDYVIGKTKNFLGMEHAPLDAEELNEKPSLASMFVIAYGIHKTLLLPFRLSLTAAITPAVAKKLKNLGWVQRKFINKK